MNVVSVSENTVLILFDQTISNEVSQQVLQFSELVKAELPAFIIDVVPSYASIHISFNLREITHHNFIEILSRLENEMIDIDSPALDKHLIEIPVYYGEEVGFDLAEMSNNAGICIEKIIQLHSETIYDVYALGFAPGFAYLGKVSKRIATPRKKSPRLKVPKGSVGIADEQTAIYPSDSPGGWNIIGRTPVDLVNYQHSPPCLMQVGDRIKFNPIEKDEFLSLGGKI